MYMLYKDLTVEAVTDVDQLKGIVTGYFSIFGNKDSDGDIVMPGAYKKTLKENGPQSEKPRILHLYMHDSYKVLGKPTVLKEDKKGLYFETQISQTALGKDVLQLYMDKVLTEHSIGYQIVKREVDEKEETQKLIELKLWEGSTVSWGANMDAIVESVKGKGIDDVMCPECKYEFNYLAIPEAGMGYVLCPKCKSPVTQMSKALYKVIEKLDALDTAMKGNYTDEVARQIEISHKQIQQAIISLVRKQEPAPSTPIPEKPKQEVTADWIINKLNLKF